MSTLTPGDAWLTSLSHPEAISFWDFVKSKAGVKESIPVDVPADLGLYESLDGGWSGVEWRAWLGCSIVTLIKPDTKYPRFQVNFNTDPSQPGIPTPNKRQKGEIPLGALVKKLFNGGAAWQSFKALAGNEAKAGTKRTVKIATHHIAYRAKVGLAALSGNEVEPLPPGAGSGSSVSHLCDNPLCANFAHLVAAPTHRENMDRQRCTGVTLIVVEGVIIDVLHCQHYLEDDEGNIEVPDCTRLKVLDLGDLVQVKPDLKDQFDAAHDKYLANKAVKDGASQLVSPRKA
jgi:hypothetical protein